MTVNSHLVSVLKRVSDNLGMWKRCLNATFVVLLFFVSNTAYGQSIVSHVLIVDQTRVFSESDLGKQLQNTHQDALTALGQENRSFETELEQEEKKLTDQKKILSETEFLRLVAEFDRKVVRTRQEQGQKGNDIKKSYEVTQRKFYQAIQPIYFEIAQKYDAETVVDIRSVIYYSPKIDITNEAISVVNQKLTVQLIDNTKAE